MEKISNELWNTITKNTKRTFMSYKWRLGILLAFGGLLVASIIVVAINTVISISMENTVIIYSAITLLICINVILYVLEDAWFSFLTYKRIMMVEKEERRIVRIFQNNKDIMTETKQKLLQVKKSIENLPELFDSICIHLALDEIDEHITTIEKLEGNKNKQEKEKYYSIGRHVQLT